MKNVFRSILAFLAAIFITFVLSYATDAVLVATGLMTTKALPESVAVVTLIIVYRTMYNTLGAYILAKLAPNHPMRHGLVLGALGIFGSLSVMFAQPDYGPAYYPIILSILILPSVWLGVKLAQRTK